MQETWLAKKRPRRSWITAHGTFLVEVSPTGKVATTWWGCHYCNILFSALATSAPASHLQTNHQKYEPGSEIRQPKCSWSVYEQLTTQSREKTVLSKGVEDNLQEAILDWLMDGDGSFAGVFEEEYAHLPVPQAEEAVWRAPDTDHGVHLVNNLFFDVNDEDEEQSDEVERYLNGPVKMQLQPLSWWLEHQDEFPRLSVMAIDLLSIPGMSTECERAFSQVKLVVGLQRHSLHNDTINELQSMKNWMRNEGL